MYNKIISMWFIKTWIGFMTQSDTPNIYTWKYIYASDFITLLVVTGLLLITCMLNLFLKSITLTRDSCLLTMYYIYFIIVLIVLADIMISIQVIICCHYINNHRTSQNYKRYMNSSALVYISYNIKFDINIL